MPVERELFVSDDIAESAAGMWRELRPATVALAGGKTPRSLYGLLAKDAAELRLDAVEFYFGDERCVPPSDPNSNYRMAYESLLSKIDADVHRMPGETCDPTEYDQLMEGVRIDLILLGLGPDGHTCSLFPGDPALDEKEKMAVRVERPDRSRLTLTYPAINASAVAVFLVSGSEKSEALRGLMEGDQSLPAARVSCERVVVIADRAAAR